ncbi:MAG: hypothetical protein B6229_03730 [Spirochaetaceae bacterium 4572_7]|nr:MAG: hypothetical protein B6229_03730 [Spirochaetaceae bacterium 4572_7]
MSIEKLIITSKRKAEKYHKQFKNGQLSSAEYLTANHPFYLNHDTSKLIKEEVKRSMFLHAVAKEKGYNNWGDLINTSAEQLNRQHLPKEKKWLEYYELKKRPLKRGDYGGTKLTLNNDVKLHEIISLVQGKDKYSSMITFTDGNYVCAKGSPLDIVSYLCNKDIPEEESDYNPNELHVFIIDPRLENPSYILDVHDEYKIDPKKSEESYDNYENRVYNQYLKNKYFWIRNNS